MDPLSEERLKALQMADLGTARREYISTVDRPNAFSRVRLEEIEANRQSNIKGSAAQRLAERNRAQLDAWANVHKVLNDTGDLEDLDPMMNGQSHRAQLSATIRESGGQVYADSTASDDSFPKALSRSPRRDPRSGGRGGGVIGTRGRRPSFPSTQVTSQGAVSKSGHRIFDSGRTRNRPLDPAVDPGREYFIKSKSHGGPRQQPHRQQKSASIKTRRPVLPDRDYESLLTDPAGFLAAFRSRRGTSTFGTNPANTSEVNKMVCKSDAAAAHSGDCPPAASQSGATTSVVSETKKSSLVETEIQPLPAQTSTPHITFKSTQGSQLSNVTQARSSTLPEVAPSEQFGQPISEGEDKTTETVKAGPAKDFISNLPRPEGIAQVPSSEEVQAPKTSLDESSDLLLDFESDTPVVAVSERLSVSSQKGGVGLPSSPAIRDLMEIDFQQEAIVPVQPSPSRPEKDPGSQETPTAGKTMTVEDTPSKPKTLISEEAVAGYLRELALLNDFMANPSLPDSMKDYVKQRKQEVETQISRAMMLKSTEDPIPSHAQQVEETVKATKSLEIKSDEDKALSQQKQSTDLKDASKKVSGQPEKILPATKAESPVDSPLWNAVTAAPFVTSSNAYAYWSPAVSISSNSSTPTPSGFRVPAVESPSKSPSMTPIIGNHLLPGTGGSYQQPTATRTASCGTTSTSVLSNTNPPAFEGFGSASQIGQSEFTFEMPMNVSPFCQNVSSNPGIQGNVPNFPLTAATKQYAMNAPNTIFNASTTHETPKTPTKVPYVPLFAASRQYAVNVPNPVSNAPTSQEAPETPTNVPYVPLSAATKQYAVNLPESEFVRPSAPSAISPNVPRQYEQQQPIYAKSGENNSSPSKTSKPAATGLYASKYADPDAFSRRPLR